MPEDDPRIAKHYRDANGIYLGMFDLVNKPEDAIECTIPAHAYDLWDFNTNQWIPWAGIYKMHREREYARIGIGEQLDAIYKFALAAGVIPDPNAGTDTPAGWVAKIQAIKNQYPKP
jgi:hypothetical protein